MNSGKIELVIMDMDGLMFNTEDLYFEAWSEAVSERGLTPYEELYKSTMGTKLSQCIDQYRKYYGEDIDAEQIYKDTDDKVAKAVESGKLKNQKGLLELIDFIDSNKIKRAIASSSYRPFILRNLRKAEIDENGFHYIISGDEVEKTKPDPEIFTKVCEKLGVSRENAIVLEDSRNGVRASYNAGIKCIMIPDLIAPDDELLEKSHLVLDSLLDVIDYLNKQNKA